MPMNPDIKKKWIEALRSGQYEQGRGHLKTDEGYCCLGVLCDIYIKENGGAWKETKQNSVKECFASQEPDSGIFTPPIKILEWAGFDNRIPYITFDDKKLTISAWMGGPDSKHGESFRKSFAEMADAIEEQV